MSVCLPLLAAVGYNAQNSRKKAQVIETLFVPRSRIWEQCRILIRLRPSPGREPCSRSDILGLAAVLIDFPSIRLAHFG